MAKRTHRVRVASELFTRHLASGMYTPAGALHEPVKNSWDAIARLRAILRQPEFEGRVELHLIKNPRNPKHPILVIVDNGTGLDSISFERFLSVGSRGESNTGMTDEKRVGRLAAFALIHEQYRESGFRVISSTSATGGVMILDVDPREMAENRMFSENEVPRDDNRLYGLSPAGSFTMIVIPYVISALNTSEKLQKALEWYLPRYKDPSGFRLFVEGKELHPPALETELVIHWRKKTGESVILTGSEARRVQDPSDLDLQPGDIYGYFSLSEKGTPSGVRINDASTLTLIAKAKDMSDRVPFPFGRPDLVGDIFIPNLVRNQNTDRTGLAPDFLATNEWKKDQDVLVDHFCKPLVRLIGDDGVVRTDPLGRSMEEVLSGFLKVWGEPDAEVKIPSGIDPPLDLGGEEVPVEDGDSPDPTDNGSSSGKPRRIRPSSSKRTKKVRPRQFNYKGVTFALDVCRTDPSIPATLDGSNTVHLNTLNRMVTAHLRRAPAALRYHILESIIRVIERSWNELAPDVCDCEVHTSMDLFYSKQGK